MNRKLRRYLIVILITIIILSVFFIISNPIKIHTKEDNIDIILTNTLNETINNSDFNKIQSDVLSILSSTNNKGDIAKENYILGYIEAKKTNYYDAIEKFIIASENLDDESDIRFKIKVYYQLSRSYSRINESDKSEENFRKSLLIAESKGTKEDQIDILTKRAMILIEVPGKVKEAINFIEKAIELATEINYYNIAMIYKTAGLIYFYDENIIQSINYQLKAIDIANQREQLHIEMYTKVEIALNYIYLNKYNEAIEYLNEVLQYKIDDPQEEASYKAYALLNLCYCYLEVNHTNNLLKSYEMLEEKIYLMEDSVEKEDTSTFADLIRGELEAKRGNLEEALKFIRIAQQRFNEVDDFYFFDFDLELLIGYGEIYYSCNQYEKAIDYFKSALEVTKERSLIYVESKISKKLYLSYLAIDDKINAFNYLKNYTEISDRIYSTQNSQYTEYLHKEFENELKQNEIESLQKNEQRMLLVILVLILLIMSTIISLLYINKKNKEIKRLNKLFKELSITDGLTGIANRRALNEFFDTKWNEYQKNKKEISFAMIDIDYFKMFNDKYGHLEGDKVLIVIAKELEKCCRKSDFIARYGGEEFIIVMLDTNKEDAKRIIERINQNIYELNIEHKYSEISDRITISVGLSTTNINNRNDYIQYIEMADNALYKVKREGRGKCFHIDEI